MARWWPWTLLGLLRAAGTSAAPLVFKGDLQGWRVRAAPDALELTWLRTGAVWRSQLLAVSATLRAAQTHLGGWLHETRQEQRGGSAVLRAARRVGEALVLEGDVPMPLGSSERWELTLAVADGCPAAIAFQLRLQNRSGAALGRRPEDGQCRGGIQACYWYSATDVSLLWALGPEERVVGAGEQFSQVDLRGRRFDLWSGEQGVGRGRLPITPLVDSLLPFQGGDAHTSYSSVPAFLSTRGYGLVLNNSQLVTVDLRTSAASLTVSFENRGSTSDLVIAGHLLGGDGVRSLLPALTLLTGRMPVPPRWALDGLVVGAEGGHEVVGARLGALLAAGVPVVAIWIQDWSGMVHAKDGDMVWWNWELDESRYPKAWMRSLATRGIRVLTYVNPMLAAQPSSSGRPPTVFLEAKRLGHLVTDTKGAPLIMSNAVSSMPYGHVDLLREDSRKWWVQLLRCNVLLACDDGAPHLVHGWMNDYGEQLLLNASVPSAFGIASDAHNIYPRLHAAAARDAIQGFENATFFARAGDLQTPGLAPMFWLGDQLTSYDGCDGLQSAVIGAMSGGMSGWTVTGTDLGGFTMVTSAPVPGVEFVRDAEMLVRWLEVGVFLNSMFRSHPGLKPSTSAQLWDAEVLPHAKNLTELFRALRPYRESLLEEAARSGLPLVRHGLLVRPQDAAWFTPRRSQPRRLAVQCGAGEEVGLQQFFLGDEVLVAPIFAAGRREVEVYLPEGEWEHLSTGTAVRGPCHTTWPAPLGQPAAFYRADEGAEWRGFFRRLSGWLSEGQARARLPSFVV